jgi:hypothetical protein
MWQLLRIAVMIMSSVGSCKVEVWKVTHVKTRQCALLPALKKRVSRHRNPSSITTINHFKHVVFVSVSLRKA